MELESLCEMFKELLKEYEEKFDSRAIFEKIESDHVLKQEFINAFIEIVRDELKNNKLTDYVDCADWFGYETHIRTLLKAIVFHLEKALEYRKQRF